MKRTTAEGAVAGAYVDYNPATATAGTKLEAEDRNNVQEEIISPIEELAITLDGAKQDQLLRAIVGLSHGLGEIVETLIEQTIGELWPAVKIDDDDQVIDEDNYPLLVPALRAIKAEAYDTTDFTCSISGSTITFPDETAANAILAAIAEAQLKFGSWTNFMSINVAGTDYAMASISTVARTIGVTGSPASGSQTVSIYPYRIVGFTTTARVLADGGTAIMSRSSADGLVAGLQVRHRMQGHKIEFSPNYCVFGGSTKLGNVNSQVNQFSEINSLSQSIITDGVNGTPLTGAKTRPDARVAHRYLWAQVYEA